MNSLFLSGYEDILEGILTPIVISIVVSIVRIALWGYTNPVALAANVCVCCFAGICTHWILVGLGWSPTLRAGVVSLVAMFSREIMLSICSEKTLRILSARIQYEISHFGRRRHDK